MAFPYKHILVIGATAGIGLAMADHFIAQGIKVTAVGRRANRLDAFVSSHGSDKASSIVFDITQLSDIPAFAQRTLKAHPTIDAVFLNAGIQAKQNFAAPNTLDLNQFNLELTTNYTAIVHLTAAFLPHLLSHSYPSALIYTGTGLSLVPAYPFIGYSASKAALDAFVVCIREQLRNTQTTVLHVSPGPVQTELHHRAMGEENGKGFGMPIEQFVEETWEGLVGGKKDIFVGAVGGSSKEQFAELVKQRDAAIGRLTQLVRSVGM